MNLNKVVLLVLGFLLCTYCVKAQGSIGCPSSDFGILDSSPVSLSCNKINISLTGRARSGIQSYQWTTKDGLILSDGNTLFPIIGRAGMYYLEVVGTNGCTGIDSVLVVSDPLKPSVDIGTTAATLTCTTTQIELTAITSTNVISYQWATTDGSIISGANTQTATISAAGTYTLIANAFNGCVNSTQLIIEADTTAPELLIISEELSCTTTEVQLSAGSSSTITAYEWSTTTGNILSGANTATPTVNTEGTYFLKVTGSNGCTTQAETIVISDKSLPTAIIEDAQQLTCSITQVQLNGTNSIGAVSYLWTTTNGNIASGATTATPTINTSGTYNLTVTGANGCTATAEITITQDAATPQADAGINGSLTCTSTQTQLDGSSSIGANTYQWTTLDGNIISGANTSTPMVNAAGTYTLTVTSTNGCTATDQVFVSADNILPSVTAIASSMLTCTRQQVQLNTNGTAGNTNHQWTTLDGTIVSGANTATPIVSAAGTYTVTITGLNGCTATASVTVLADKSLPIAEIAPVSSLDCTTSQIRLIASTSTNTNGYQWTTTNGTIENGANTAQPIISSAGTYVLVTTSTNGCTAQTQVVVNQDNSLPVVNINPVGSLNCTNTQLQLTANYSNNVTDFQWTTTDGTIVSGFNTAELVISAAGTYFLTVRSSNNCTAQTQITVGQNTAAPIATIAQASQLTCQRTQIQLDGSSTIGAVSYNWTTPNGNIVSGANTAQPIINAEGTYILTASGTNGCTSTAQIVITKDNNLPAAIIGSVPTLTCTIQEAQLNGVASTNASSYQWTTTNGIIVSGATTATPTVSASGIYELLVTASNGCTSTAQVNVRQDAVLPIIQIASPSTLTCTQQQLQLDASASSSVINYQWSTLNGNIVSGASTAFPIIDATGTYTLVASGGNGCTTQSQVLISQDSNRPIASILPAGQLSCTTNQLQLNGTTSTGAATYQWTTVDGNIRSGATTATPLINSSGTYTLTVSAVNGCTATTQVIVSQDKNLPTATIATPPTLTCTNQQAQLNASASVGAVSYQWSTSNGTILNGATTALPIIASAGVYEVLVRGSNGCAATARVTVNQNNSLPIIQIAPVGTIGCSATQLQLNASGTTGATSYQWSTTDGLILNGVTTPTPTIGAAGTYRLSARNDNGCIAQSQIIVEQDTDLPPPNIAPAGQLSCTTTQLMLLGSSALATSYQWTTTNGNIVSGASTAFPIINAGGTYVLTITGGNGCTSTAQVTVGQDNSVPNIQIAPVGRIDCLNPRLQLNAGGTTGATSYQWSSNNGLILNGRNTPTPTVSSAGTYTLVVNGSNGCTAQTQIVVEQNMNLSPPTIAPVGLLSCTVTELQLIDTSPEASSYQWTTTDGNIVSGATTSFATINAPGTYVLMISASSGCTSSAQVTVRQDNSMPNIQIVPVGNIGCSSTQVQLNASGTTGATSYQWSTTNGLILSGTTTPTPTIGAAGTYMLSVRNTNGCTAQSQIVVGQDTDLPPPNIAPAGQLSCTTTQLMLLGSSVLATSYQWTTTNGNIVSGASTAFPIINAGGTYVLTITAGNGCTSMAQVTVRQDNSMPNIQIVPVGNIGCSTSQLQLNASGTTGATSYQWSTINGLILSGATTPTPTIGAAGTYRLSARNTNGCTAQSQIVVGQDTDLPPPNIAPAGQLSCTTTQLMLLGSSALATSYQWTTTNGNIVSGATTAFPIINAGGTYVLTITAGNGCTSTAQVTVGQDNSIPNIQIAPVGRIDCLNPSLQLNATGTTGATSYQWSSNNGLILNGRNTPTPTISSAGTYTLVVSSSNGCTAQSQIVVEQNTNLPPPTIAPVGLLSCTVTELQLIDTSPEASSYLWTTTDGNIVRGATTSFATINAPGTYVLMISTSSGCTSTAQITVGQDNTIPTIRIASPESIGCGAAQVQLNATTSIGVESYQWTSLDGVIVNGANTPMPVVSAAGTYTLMASGSNGCSTQAQVIVNEDTNVPIAVISPAASLSCITTQVQLGGNASIGAVSYQWTTLDGRIMLGANTPFPIVDAAGTYQLTVTASNGCTSTAETIVTVDNNNPTAIITPAPVLTCARTSIQLDASNSTNAFSYEWTTIDGILTSGMTTARPMISAPGTYNLLVMGNNGCVNTSSITILQDENAPQVIINNPPMITCARQSVIIDASTSFSGGGTYQWSTENGIILFGQNTPFLTVGSGGIYTLLIIAANGCINSQSVEVRAIQETSTSTINRTICAGEVLQVGNNSYNTPGFHTATLNGANQYGCDSIVTINLQIQQPIVNNITVNLCVGQTYLINNRPYTVGGSYSETFVGQGRGGCDSIVNFEIIPITPVQLTVQQVICEGSFYEFGNNRYSIPGSYTAILPSDNPTTCDSIVQLDISYSTTALEIIAPSDLLISCSDVNPYPVLQINNKENLVSLEDTETTISQDQCGKIIERNWVATDICGKQLTAQQIIEIRDFDAPVFEPLPDITLETCGQEDFLAIPIVTDNCDLEVALQMTETKVQTTACAYEVYRIWTATDNCGNVATIDRSIKVVDNLAPSIIFKTTAFDPYTSGDTLYFSCGSAPVLDGTTAMLMDNCDPNPRLDFIENIEYYDACGILMYCSWRGTDACGNSDEIGFYFRITDEESPVFDQYPHDITVASLYEAPPPATIHATDNCNNHLHVDFRETTEETDCYNRIVRSWTTADDCGNEEAYFQYINAPKSDQIADCTEGVRLRVRAGLQGAIIANTPLMTDDLRAKELLPLEEPYSSYEDFTHYLNGGQETIQPSVLQIEGNNAIVDWIFLELRNASHQVVATRSALLQRDGDVVDVDGSSPVSFAVAQGTYYVAIRHRNHLGAMSATPIRLTDTAETVVDFCTAETLTYGDHAQVLSDFGYVLRGGNTNGDKAIIYGGIGNDRDPIFFDILANPANAEYSYNFILQEYNRCDTNLDGQVIYQGTGNEIDQAIFFNILFHPSNVKNHLNFIIEEQLPSR